MRPLEKQPEIQIAFTPNELKERPNDLQFLILMLIKKDYEIRIGSDGFCLILQANDSHNNENGFEWKEEID